MGTIIKKNIKGQTYYYYVESKRINGKPKYVNQKYIGSAEKLLKLIENSGKSLQDQVLYAHETDFGAVALLYDIAIKLGVIEIVDSVCPKRRQGASIGTYILTAAINRAVDPSSKSGLKEWYEKTALPGIYGLKPSTFSPQNFWNNTDITAEQLREIEDKLLQASMAIFGIDLNYLIYDATNFFTYIDTMNSAELAQRGHDKAKRTDLKTVGLALIVTPDFAIPVLSEAYPGNRSDARQFSEMIGSLKGRFRKIAGHDADITLVFDRGNNSEDNLDLLESEELSFHYIAGLKKNQVSELYSVKKSEYIPLECPENATEKYRKLTVYRRKLSVFGREVTAIIIFNPELEAGQMQGISINTEKTKADLLDLQERLLRRAKGEITKGKRPTAESVEKTVSKILKKREYMQDIFEYEIFQKENHVFLTFSTSDSKLAQLRELHLGKTALFTDRDDLTDYQIIEGYRSAWHVEHAFKQMKDTDFLTVRPIFHWTDQKISVHLFICVLAYRLCALLRKALHDQQIECNIDQVLSSMSSVKKVTTFYGSLEKPQKIDAYIEGDALAKQIESLFCLQRKYSS